MIDRVGADPTTVRVARKHGYLYLDEARLTERGQALFTSCDGETLDLRDPQSLLLSGLVLRRVAEDR